MPLAASAIPRGRWHLLFRRHFGSTTTAPFHDWVKQRQPLIKETDYSPYVAQVTKAQIEDYIAFAYSAVEVSDSGTFRLQELARIKAVEAAFAPDKLYALVAECD